MAHYEPAQGIVGHCLRPFEHLGEHGPRRELVATMARPSAASLLIEARMGEELLGTATGFVVARNGRNYLMTNRHVVRGERQLGVSPTRAPNNLLIAHNVSPLGSWEFREEPLFDEAGPLWYEHPVRPEAIDVAALPLTNDGGVQVYPYDPWEPGPGLAVGVAEPLHIIGFPFGVTGGGRLGVWIRGFIATEPEIDWNDLPCFLVDSRTRSGQSGSPVIAFISGGMVALADGSSAVFGGPVEQFFGIYSGRINSESDLGIVWKAGAIRDVVEGASRASS